MFKIDGEKTIHLTRGDAAVINVSVANNETGDPYVFAKGDVVRLNVVEKKNHNNIVLQKDVVVSEETTEVTISLRTVDTKIGVVIDKPTVYWYEVILNPDTRPQTIIGYDEEGPKVLRLYPEGKDVILDSEDPVDTATELVKQAVRDLVETGELGVALTPARIGEVTLLADAWEGEARQYSQVVSLDGVTENSQVDLTPSAEQLAVFYEKDITFVTENVGGTVTVYAVGQKPQNDYTIQVTITEVKYE